MANITQMGGVSETLFLKQENHKLHHEFEVAADQTIGRGNLVTLNALGEVVLAADGALARNVIGYSIHDGAAGEMVTVVMKAHTIVFAKPNLALDAGAVAYDGTNDEDNRYNSFDAATAAEDVVGWAIDQSTGADEKIRVALL